MARQGGRGQPRHRAGTQPALAALMAELPQSVVVCNLDGRILLFNDRARLQFRAWSRERRRSAGGAELLGLGRSIYAVFDRRWSRMRWKPCSSAWRAARPPSAQFVTATRRRPVAARADGAGARARGRPPSRRSNGFVLMLDNITREVEQTSRARPAAARPHRSQPRRRSATCRRRWRLLELPELEPTMRARFQAVVRDEVGAMTARVQALARDALDAASRPAGRWKTCSAPICSPRRCARIEAQSAAVPRAPRWTSGALAEGRQLSRCCRRCAYLAGAAGRRVRRAGAAAAPAAGRRARAARPGVDRPGDEHRDRDGLGDRAHAHRRPRPRR